MNDFDHELPQSDAPIDLISSFDYYAIEESTRILVFTRAGEIKFLMKQNAENIIQIGLKLMEVKECLGHGRFGQWLKAEFGWGTTTAWKFMQVASKFSYCENLEDFAPSALYLLAEPSTPDAARDIALERAAQGESISHKIAKQIVAETKKASKRGVLKDLLKSKPAIDPEEPEEGGEPVALGEPMAPVASEPIQNQEPVHPSQRDLSTCQWKKDRGQERHLQINLYDQQAGMKLEDLALKHERSPMTIVIWGLDALAVLPDREKTITELTMKLQDSQSQMRALQARLAELEQSTSEKDSRLAELEQTGANSALQNPTTDNSRLEELELWIAQKDSQLEELKQALAEKPLAICPASDSQEMELAIENEQKDARIAELEEQLACAEYYATQASVELEEFNKTRCKPERESTILAPNTESESTLEPNTEPVSTLEQESLPEPGLTQQSKRLPSGKPQPNRRSDLPNMKSLIEFFDAAAEKVQKPSVKIFMNGFTLELSRNSVQHPGALNIRANGGWVGRIEADGRLYKIWEWDEWVMPMLVSFAANPAEMAAQHGRSSGFCCFCNRDLSDERSLATGYGATCAQHYRLQWPLETKLSANSA